MKRARENPVIIVALSVLVGAVLNLAFYESLKRKTENANLYHAMDLCQQASMLTRQAADLEEQAARMVPYAKSEPSRSIMFLSAASLAFQCGRFERVIDLASEGLRGEPRDETCRGLENIITDAIRELRRRRGE